MWERVNNNYQKFLASINNIIQQSLGETSTYSITTLSARLIQEKKKSSEANIESAKHISDSFLKMMNMIKIADGKQRAALRESLFPFQCTRKYYAQIQRNLNRSLDNDEKKNYRMN